MTTRHPDAKLGKDGNRTLGSLYDLYAPARDKKVNPIGAWNTARIVSRGAHVEHWLNGAKILEYTRFTPEFRQRVRESKFRVWPGFRGTAPGTHPFSSDHGDEVSFRNIKIRISGASLRGTVRPPPLPDENDPRPQRFPKDRRLSPVSGSPLPQPFPPGCAPLPQARRTGSVSPSSARTTAASTTSRPSGGLPEGA